MIAYARAALAEPSAPIPRPDPARRPDTSRCPDAPRRPDAGRRAIRLHRSRHPAEPPSGGADAGGAAAHPQLAEGLARQQRVARLGDGIARLGAHIDAAIYRQLVMIREFDELEGWHLECFKSCAQWLSWRIGLAPGAARERVRVARALASLPRLSEVMRRGRLSYSAARALTRVATPETEAELVEVARHTTAAQLEKLVRGWRALDRASETEGERARHEQRGLSLVPDPDGSWDLRGRLDPDVGAEGDRMLEWAEAILRARGALEPDATPRQRRADAFGLLVEAARDGLLAMARGVVSDGQGMASDGGSPEAVGEGSDGEGAETEGRGAKRARVASRADRYQVVVHVSAETLRAPAEPTSESADWDGARRPPGRGPSPAGESRIEGGPRVSAETSRRLACDAGIVVMTHDAEGNVLDVGRRTRSLPAAIRRALDRRDGGCRFPGCTSRVCDGHHIHHWADGGETKLDNLALLCRWHHRRVHEGGWRMELGEGGEARFYRPDGRLLPEVPPRPEVPGDPVSALEREQRHLSIDAWTPTTRWLGDPLDVDWALFTLWRPAEKEAPGSDGSASRDSAETAVVGRCCNWSGWRGPNDPGHQYSSAPLDGALAQARGLTRRC